MSLADYCYETTNHARSYTYTYLGPDRLEYSIILKTIGKKSIIYNLLSLNIYKKVLPTKVWSEKKFTRICTYYANTVKVSQKSLSLVRQVYIPQKIPSVDMIMDF